MDFTAAAAQRWFLTDTHCHFRTLQNIYFYADEKNQNSLCNYISESTFSNLSVKPKEFFNLFLDTKVVPCDTKNSNTA